MTREGEVVAWSDRIAYINHDIDDAIRAGVITQDDIPRQYIDKFGTNNGARINSMIMDIIDNSYFKPLVIPSPDFVANINGLRSYMTKNVYESSVAKAEEHKAIDMIKFLYQYFLSHVSELPEEFKKYASSDAQKVVDYISMMSDIYAVRLFEEITVPKNWTKL